MSFRYGKKGEVLRKIIAEDQVWRYHYDHHGCLSTIIDPKGNSTAVTLDVLGRLFSHQNALGELTRYTHSDAHASPAGSVTKWSCRMVWSRPLPMTARSVLPR